MDLLKHTSGAMGPFDAEILKARDVILAWAMRSGRSVPAQDGTLKYVNALQNLGDEMRSTRTVDGSEDHAAVARALSLRIRHLRAEKTGIASDSTEPVYRTANAARTS